jgi:hypothetical protein
MELNGVLESSILCKLDILHEIVIECKDKKINDIFNEIKNDFLAILCESEIDNTQQKFFDGLTQYKISIRIENLFNDVQNIQNVDDKLKKKYMSVPKIKCDVKIQKKIECINCLQEMFMDDQGLEYYCALCGSVEPIIGSENEQTLASKNIPYDQEGHTLKRFLQLQAKEPFTPSKELIIHIKTKFLEMGIKRKQQITISTLRKCLTGMSEYYAHIPYLYQYLSGKELINYTEEEQKKIIYYTNRAMKIISDNHNGKSPYHPFIIMKVTEEILPELTDMDKHRKASLLSYFHLQTSQTIENKDTLWQSVCSELGLKFRPTNMSRYDGWIKD